MLEMNRSGVWSVLVFIVSLLVGIKNPQVSKNGGLDYLKNLDKHIQFSITALWLCRDIFSVFVLFPNRLIRDPPLRSTLSTHGGQIMEPNLMSLYYTNRDKECWPFIFLTAMNHGRFKVTFMTKMYKRILFHVRVKSDLYKVKLIN